MDWDEYEEWGRRISRWGSKYHKSIRDFPVRSKLKSGHVYQAIGEHAPETGEPMEKIMDAKRIVIFLKLLTCYPTDITW